jgi:hypothetical protein
VDIILGGWQIVPAVNIQSGFPLAVIQADNTGTLSGVQRPNLVQGADFATSGNFEDRLASADHPGARWLNPAAFSAAPANTYGNAPRTITDLRSPMQHNVDASFAKNFRFGTKSAQIRIEMLNLLNDPLVSALNGRNTFSTGSATFGGIAVQRGFMRITQLMFRFSF